MSEVKTIVVQMRRPSPGDEGQVTAGHYIVEGNTLIMTLADGTPVEGFRYELRAGDDAEKLAAQMTTKVRRQLLGISETEEAFARVLRYNDAGVA